MSYVVFKEGKQYQRRKKPIDAVEMAVDLATSESTFCEVVDTDANDRVILSIWFLKEEDERKMALNGDRMLVAMATRIAKRDRIPLFHGIASQHPKGNRE